MKLRREISYIRHSIDTRDEFYDGEIEFWDLIAGFVDHVPPDRLHVAVLCLRIAAERYDIIQRKLADRFDGSSVPL